VMSPHDSRSCGAGEHLQLKHFRVLARSSDQQCGCWKQAAVLAHAACFLEQPTQVIWLWLSSGATAADKAANIWGIYHAPCTSVPRWVLRTLMEKMNSLCAGIGGQWDRTKEVSSTTEDVVAHRSYLQSIPVESPKRGSPFHGHVHGVQVRAGAGGAAERRRRARRRGAGSRLGGAARQAGGVTGRQCVAQAVSVCTAGRGVILSRETSTACPNN